MVHAQSPHLWRKAGGLEPIAAVADLFTDHLERSSVALADAVVSPSRRAPQLHPLSPSQAKPFWSAVGPWGVRGGSVGV